ncbi:MAG TPA: hypothetical protein VGJ39_01200 [Vicinamibacterales bacterium]|jgi:hypothetical protein
MTPFDPIALLVMLQTFYPIVGPAAFERARRERPEYFSGGTIIGTGRDKVQLPDGRIFDCIFNVGGIDQRWQVLEIPPGAGPGGPADPFALDEGPLTPIDESAFPEPAPMPFFEPLVVQSLVDLGYAGPALDGAHAQLTDAGAPGDLDAWLGGELGTGAGVLDQQLRAVDAFVPADVVAQTAGQSRATDAHEGLFNEPIPPAFPPIGDPIHHGPLTPEP